MSARAPDAMIEVERISVELGGQEVLKDVSLRVERAEFMALVGPNGSGKTTLLRTLYRAITPKSGQISIEGQPLETLGQREVGQRIAVLRQESTLAFDFLVEELVLMGRSPYKTLLSPDRAEDRAIAAESLDLTGTADLAKRSFGTLSGGERQRVLLARALAQQPRVMLLDEPTNHLDIRHQLEVLECVKSRGITVLAALHDLNLALAFASSAVLLVDGKVQASGTPGEVLTDAQIARAFGVRVERFRDAGGRDLLSFRVAP